MKIFKEENVKNKEEQVDDNEKRITNDYINEKVNAIAEKFTVNKYQSREKELWLELIHKVLLNEKTKNNRNNLLDIIYDVECYKEYDAKMYIEAAIANLIIDYPQNKYVIVKEKMSGSNHSLVSDLMMKGYISEGNLIQCSKTNNNKYIVESKEIEEDSIIIVIDDYVGSGGTIIDILKEIELKYKKQNVKIIAYIWQEKAMDVVNDYINESEKNNDYEMLVDDCELAKTYKDKYESNSRLKEYIEKVCDTCRNDRYKFGYRSTGAMLTIEGLSPNNNISMLWRNDLGDDKSWVPPFSRDMNMFALKCAKEQIIKTSYGKMQEYYKKFAYKNRLDFNEFKMLLLLFNAYCIKQENITNLLGLDTLEDTKELLEKFGSYGIITYSADNHLEFIDYNVIRQFKMINKHISKKALDAFGKNSTSKLHL